jgi:hypothetical protein
MYGIMKGLWRDEHQSRELSGTAGRVKATVKICSDSDRLSPEIIVPSTFDSKGL